MVEVTGGLQLLRKVVGILDVLAREGEATAAQIAEAIGEPRASVYRLLKSLRDEQMVEEGDQRGSHRLGLRLLSYGEAIKARFRERERALPAMQRLHDETGETIFLCVRRGSEAVCIERLDGQRVQSLALQVGGVLPLHAGAASRVLLAHAGRDFWHSYIEAGPLQRLTPSTPVMAEELIPALEETLRTGVAVSDEDVTVGIAAIGVPIRDYTGTVRAALSISGVQSAIFGTERVQKALIEAGQEISRSLGAGLAAT